MLHVSGMDDSGQYFSSGLYPSRGDYLACSVPGNPPYGSQSTCVYGKSPVPGAYGAQPMSVVDRQMLATAPEASSAPLPPFTSSLSGLTNNNPAHISPNQTGPADQLHQNSNQPPPAHQNHGKGGEGGKGRSRSEGSASSNALHFPWMKTTKSHAHQWKAHWPGKCFSVYI